MWGEVESMTDDYVVLKHTVKSDNEVVIEYMSESDPDVWIMGDKIIMNYIKETRMSRKLKNFGALRVDMSDVVAIGFRYAKVLSEPPSGLLRFVENRTRPAMVTFYLTSGIGVSIDNEKDIDKFLAFDNREDA